MFVRSYFLERSTGTSERGQWYKLTLLVSLEDENSSLSKTTASFFVDEEIYRAVASCKDFAEVEAIFMPSASGKCRLVSCSPM